MRPIVFLHIPKTAGQTVYNELRRLVGADAVSPVRVHTQAPTGAQMPPGFSLYSGHLDWAEIEALPVPFVFTVLRDPCERIASFYFYLLKEAQRLSPTELGVPCNLGKSNILSMSAEEYFFGGTPAWQTFVREHYDNFYCSYFATRKMRGWSELRTLSDAEVIRMARAGLARMDRVYWTTGLGALERDIAERYGATVRLAGNYQNSGSLPQGQARWPQLLDLLETDAARRRLHQFVTRDEDLLAQTDFA